MLSNPRTFYRVMAGAIAYGFVIYVVSGGSEQAAELGLAKLIPVLLSVIAIWAAVVDEEVILWAMAVCLTLFGFVLMARGTALIGWSGLGLILITALTRDARTRASQDRSRQIR